MNTFKVGDRVTHRVYGEVTVAEVDEGRKLVAVASDNFPNLWNFVHPVALTKLTVSKFEARIEWTRGAVTLSGPLDKEGLRRYLSRLDENDMNGYTVTRLNNER